MWNKNGILIQDVTDFRDVIKNFKYLGINAFYSYPLSFIENFQCRKLTLKQQSRKITENQYQSLEFISDKQLFEQYMKTCYEHKIDIRVLFIESAYTDEIWEEPLPCRKFLGYEYCPIPIDDQIITDIDWYPPFAEYWTRLNEYGLFNTFDEANAFKNRYDVAFNNDEIGDGEMDAYICRVSEVCL